MRIIKKLMSVLLTLIIGGSLALVSVIPAGAVASSTGTYRITAASLNIRSTPSTSSSMVGSYNNGASVSVTSISGTWGKVSAGWIDLNYAGIMINGTFSCTIKTNTCVNLRTGIGTSFASLGTMNNGTAITVYNQGYWNENYWWWMVYVPALGKYGFVVQDYISW